MSPAESSRNQEVAVRFELSDGGHATKRILKKATQPGDWRRPLAGVPIPRKNVAGRSGFVWGPKPAGLCSVQVWKAHGERADGGLAIDVHACFLGSDRGRDAETRPAHFQGEGSPDVKEGVGCLRALINCKRAESVPC